MKIAIITNIGRITELSVTKHIWLGKDENEKYYAITRNKTFQNQYTPDFTFLPKSVIVQGVAAGNIIMFSPEGVTRLENTATDAQYPQQSFGLLGARFLSGTVRNGMMLPQIAKTEPFGSIFADGINKKDYKPANTYTSVGSAPVNNNIAAQNAVNTQSNTTQIVWIPYYN